MKPQENPAFARAAFFLLPAAAAIIVYWRILFLPNIYDTLLHTQLAENLSVWSVWLPNDDFGFYRPLVFLPLVLIQDWLGYPAPLLQFLNLAQHALNAVLLAVLVDRLSGRRPLAVFAALLLAVFPFGYQALAIYGNNAYLTVTGFILWGLILGLTGRPTARRMWGLAGVQLAGFLVHETAVLLLPLLALALWLTPNSKYEIRNTKYESGAQSQIVNQGTSSSRQETVTLNQPFVFRISYFVNYGPITLVWLAYLLFYVTLPRGGGPLLDYGGNALWPKVLLFGQTLAHPFAWFAHLLPDVSAQLIILSGVMLTAALLAWGWLRLPTQRPLLLLGLGWWVMASLLVGVTLPTYYIADGARLLYPGAPGLAIVWGVALLPRLNRDADSGRIEQITLAVGLLFVLVSGGQFIRQMIGYYELISEPVDALSAALVADEEIKRVILVNPPQWISPPRNTYAIGTEFAPLLGDHLFAAELLRANGINQGERLDVTILSAPGLGMDTPFNVGLFDIRAQETIRNPGVVFVTLYRPDGLETTMAGAVREEIVVADRPLGTVGPYQLLFSNAITLCDGRLQVSMGVRPIDPPPATLSLFVQAIGSGGLISQADGPPLGVPPARIAGDWSLVDVRFLTGEELPDHVLIGAYDFTTGERFPAITADGEPLPDNAWVVEVEMGCE